MGLSTSQKTLHRFYRLACSIRVRDEKFGLLFYDRRGPKLTFLYSGQWIRSEFFSGEQHLKQWVRRQFSVLPEEKLLEAEEALFRALSKLIEKGLIIETLADS
jgi:putative mycofactocin binding protein MftB